MKDVLGPPVLRALQRALREDLPGRLQRVLGVALGAQHLGYAVVRYDAECVQLGCVRLAPGSANDSWAGNGEPSAAQHFPQHIADVFRGIYGKYRDAKPPTESAGPWVIALRQIQAAPALGAPSAGAPRSPAPRDKAAAVPRPPTGSHLPKATAMRFRLEGMLVTALPLLFEVPSVRILAPEAIQRLLAQRLQEPLSPTTIELETVAQKLVPRFPPPTEQTPKDVTRSMSAAWATAYATLMHEQLEVVRRDPCVVQAVHRQVDQCPKVQELREARDAHLQALCSSAASIHQAYKSLRAQRSEALTRRLLFNLYAEPQRPSGAKSARV